MRKLGSHKTAHWLILIVGVCVTLLVWELARRDSTKQLQEEFEFHVSQVTQRIEKRIQDARLILLGTTGLFNASDKVTRKEFKAYIESLQIQKNYN